jgi:hypothetical protein
VSSYGLNACSYGCGNRYIIIDLHVVYEMVLGSLFTGLVPLKTSVYFYYHFVVLRIKQADLDIIGNNWINSFELSERTMNSFPNEYYSV